MLIMKDDSNYNAFLQFDLEGYEGKWVVLCDENIVVVGDNVNKILNEAKKKCPNKRLMLAKVPEENFIPSSW